MKHFLITWTLIGLFFGDPFFQAIPAKNLWAGETTQFLVQVASCSTLTTARKEIERLKKFNLEAQYTIREDRSKKKWFIIYIDHFKTKEEATRFGNQLTQKGVIQNFKVYPKKRKEDSPAKVKGLPDRLPGLYSLQVASLPTELEAQKEVERLKEYDLSGKITTLVDKNNKSWFVVYLDSYPSKEEALNHGSQLGQKNIIHSYRVFIEKEGLPSKIEAPPPPSAKPSTKEPKALREESPVYFGPIAIKEEENTLRISIYLDQKIFPEINADKTAEGSRLIITFKNIDKPIVPMEFNKIQSKTLLSFSLARKGSDCTFTLLLNPSFNYQVSQDYYERDRVYSMVVGREPTVETDSDPKK